MPKLKKFSEEAGEGGLSRAMGVLVNHV